MASKADATANYTVALRDEVSGSATSAADSLEALNDKINAGQKKLKEMEAALRKLKAGGKGTSAAAAELKDKITAQKAAIASAQEQYVKLGGAFGKTTPKAQGIAGALGELLGQAKGLPGPLGSVAGRLTGIGGIAGGVSLAIGAVVGAMVALLAITARTTVALLRYGIAQSNARRSEMLRIEGLALLPQLYGRARAGGAEMQAAIDRASDSTTLGRDELARYGDQLSRLGIRGAALSTSLEVLGMAATAAGERGAAFARRMLLSAAQTGQSLDEVADRLRGRFGPLARRVMLDWNVQAEKLRQNLDRLFSGLRIEAFLQGVQSILAVFSQTTVTGRALKNVIESLFQPLLDAVTDATPLVRRIFQGIVLGALLVERQILRIRLWFRETFGDASPLAGLDTQMLVFKAGAALVVMFATAVVLAAAGLAALGVAAAAIISPILTLGAAAVGVGSAIVDGLVAGLRGGIARVTQTVRSIADSVRTTFRNVLQIRSPSRVFAELGAQIPAGVTMGIEAGSPDASGAAAELVQPPAGAAGGRGGASITITELHIHAQTNDPREHARTLVDELAALLEGSAITMGAPA